jgi:chaperonin GroES
MANPKITPIGGNILVQPIDESAVSASGIVLPDSVDKEKPQKGKVIALGSGKISNEGKKIEFNVKVGDIVLFKKYSPDEIEVDNQDYLIMDENDVLAILG